MELDKKMKYILLASSLIFGVTGLCQAMDAFKAENMAQLLPTPYIFNFQILTVSLTPVPGFVRVLILSAGLFALYLIWKKLKGLGMGRLSEYVL